MAFQAGRQVEVYGEEEGFSESWAVATIVEVKEAASSIIPTLVLHYNEFVDEEGKPEREELSARSLRLRPAWPASASPASLSAYQVGAAVDCLQNDVWWKATVIAVSRAGVEVLFTGSGDRLVCSDPATLRPGKEWIGGAWRERDPLPLPASVLRQQPAQPEQQQAPLLERKGKKKKKGKGKAAGRPDVQRERSLKENSDGEGGGAAAQGGRGSSRAGQSAQPVLVRRSQRERQERVILVDGQPVLRANNYDIETGERSVFDQELKRRKPGPWNLEGPSATWVALKEPPAQTAQPARAKRPAAAAVAAAVAAAYDSDAEEEEGVESDGSSAKGQETEAEAGHSHASENGAAAESESESEDDEGEEAEEEEQLLVAPAFILSPGGTRRPSTAQTARRHLQQHNEMIREAAKASEPRKALFLEQQIPVLQPFVEPEVLRSISAKADQARALGPQEMPEPVEFQPDAIKATMREYQLEGLRWLVSRFDHGVNAILSDEMGLGKTLQTISFLAYLKFHRFVEGPHLVVVPLSVLPSWMNEFAKWCPAMRVVRVHTNDAAERDRIKREVLSCPDSFDVAVTTYDTIRSPHWGQVLSRTIRWRYLVMDEGHRIKNEDTLISNAMRHVQCQHVLLLTGTPLQNNLHELWALLFFMYPDVFTTSDAFDSAFDLQHAKVDNAKLEAAHHLLKPFCLRRLKEEVERNMPPKVETRISCPLSAMQTFWYRRLLLKDKAALQAVEKEVEGAVKYDTNNTSWKKLMMLVQQLRKCCNHPYLFGTTAEPDFDGESTGEDIVDASGKLEVLDRLLAKLKARGHRVCLFSQFNMMLDVLEDYMNMRGYKYCRLDGSTNRVRRMIDMQLFNKPGSDIFVYLLNTRAGGLGVNLQTADTCILYDSDWNPQADAQAMARVHRIGQTKPVHVYRLCTVGTVEERIQQRAEKKLYLDQMVNRGSLAGMEQLESLSKKEVLSMLKFGADRIFENSEGRPPSDAELDTLIDRSSMQASAAVKAEEGAVKEEVVEEAHAAGDGQQEAHIRAVQQTAADFNAETKPLSCYIMNGKDYRQVDTIKDIGREFWQQQKDQLGNKQRERKKRTVNINGFDVLLVNNYDLNQGEPSVFQREALGLQERCGKRKHNMQIAGRDYDHQDFCQVCWDGGDLVCCDGCPAAYHPECLGMSLEEIEAQKRWMCPQHACCVCSKKSGAVGGMLFRCEACPQAYCEDHLAPDAEVVVTSERYQDLGMQLPSVACYIRCTPECMEVARRAYDLAQKEGRSASRQVSPAQPALQALPPAAAQPPAAAAVQAAVAAAAAAAQQRQGVPLQAGVGQKPGGKAHVSGHARPQKGSTGRPSSAKAQARLSGYVAAGAAPGQQSVVMPVGMPAMAGNPFLAAAQMQLFLQAQQQQQQGGLQRAASLQQQQQAAMLQHLQQQAQQHQQHQGMALPARNGFHHSQGMPGQLPTNGMFPASQQHAAVPAPAVAGQLHPAQVAAAAAYAAAGGGLKRPAEGEAVGPGYTKQPKLENGSL